MLKEGIKSNTNDKFYIHIDANNSTSSSSQGDFWKFINILLLLNNGSCIQQFLSWFAKEMILWMREKSSKSGQRAFKHTWYVRNQRQGVAFGKPVL